MCIRDSLWNGKDPILKERLFGLGGKEGNHGEDVKELYFYLDSSPTHSYMKMLYKYPQQTFPYDQLTAENARRGRKDPEFELDDTGVFDEDRYFDCLVEYAKAEQDHICMQITITNRGPESASLSLIPTLWFRNTWSWGYPEGPMGETPQKPNLHRVQKEGKDIIEAFHPKIGTYYLTSEQDSEFLFTENNTNTDRIKNLGIASSEYSKDAFHRYLIDGEKDAVNPKEEGTNCLLYTSPSPRDS